MKIFEITVNFHPLYKFVAQTKALGVRVGDGAFEFFDDAVRRIQDRDERLGIFIRLGHFFCGVGQTVTGRLPDMFSSASLFFRESNLVSMPHRLKYSIPASSVGNVLELRLVTRVSVSPEESTTLITRTW